MIWFISVCIVYAFVAFTYVKGWLGWLLFVDVTGISIALLVFGLFITVCLGLSVKWMKDIHYAFAADTCMRAGLAGTLIGFILMVTSLIGLDTTDTTAVKEMLFTFSTGLGTAFSTTLVGLLSKWFIEMQLLITGVYDEI